MEYTAPEVLTTGVEEGWADPITDPTQIDWASRQKAALIPFMVVNGRPVNPVEPDHPIERGRNELGHWAELGNADAIVIAPVRGQQRRMIMIEREDGHGIAVPGGGIEEDETPLEAALRELAEEAGLELELPARGEAAPFTATVLKPRYVRDPRASREAWMVTAPVVIELAEFDEAESLPELTAATDAKHAAWMIADNYDVLVNHLAQVYEGEVFTAHQEMLKGLLNGTSICKWCSVRIRPWWGAWGDEADSDCCEDLVPGCPACENGEQHPHEPRALDLTEAVVSRTHPRFDSAGNRYGAELRTDAPQIPRGAAYFNGDDGYLWLTCGHCEASLKEVDAGCDLADLLTVWHRHKCEEPDHVQ